MVSTELFVPGVPRRPSFSVSRTSTYGGSLAPGARCTCTRNRMSVVPGSGPRVITVCSPGNTPGPVVRFEQSLPGCHHHTPPGSSGSTATQIPEPTPTSIGLRVTTYCGAEWSGSGFVRSHPTSASGNNNGTTILERPPMRVMVTRARGDSPRGELGAYVSMKNRHAQRSFCDLRKNLACPGTSQPSECPTRPGARWGDR